MRKQIPGYEDIAKLILIRKDSPCMSLMGEPIPLVCEYWFAKLRLHDIRSRIIKMEDATSRSRRQDRLYCSSCDAEKLLYNYIYNLEIYARLIGEDLSFPFDEVDRAD